MKTVIKICGLTNEQDALHAIDAGADYLGLIFVPNTPRALSIEQARPIVEAVRRANADVRLVGVFQNQAFAEVQNIVNTLQLDFAQLHGEESLSDCQMLSVPVIKTMTLGSSETSALKKVQQYILKQNIHGLLFDVPKGSRSHIEKVFSVNVQKLVKDIPYFIAGSLQPDTVYSTVQRIQPWGVDVASGVEIEPGKKSQEKMRAFCDAVHATESFSQEETV